MITQLLKTEEIKMKLKKISITLFVVMCICIEVSASVIGNLTSNSVVNFGAGATLFNNSYVTGSEKQEEFYVEYIPNPDAVPVIINGEQIYGRRTITEAAKYYDSLDLRPLLAINADYFSYKTGIPMGHTIAGGELVTKDATGQNAIGFMPDGSAFVSWLEIQTRLITDNGEMYIDCINKWCQPGSVGSYFLTDYFADDTKTQGDYRYVIFSKDSGTLKIGEESVFTVEEKFDTTYNIAIEDEKYVLVMDKQSGNPNMLAFMDSLQIGQKVKIFSESVYDKELWNNAANGMGSVGGRLLENGEIYKDLEEGIAPRTAVGVKADGTVVFYVVDGRQINYSNGLTLKKLAARMKEIGCIEAINLDGGGSTAIAGVYPGSDTFDVLNNPSEGTLRSCANYIFLQDNRTPTGIPSIIKLKNQSDMHYLSGSEIAIEPESMWDTHNFRMDTNLISYNIISGSETGSYMDDNILNLTGNGTVTVSAGYGELSVPINMNVYSFPDTIIVKNSSGTVIPDNLTLTIGESYITELLFESYLNEYQLNATKDAYSVNIQGDIGTYDGTFFTANTSAQNTGSIIIKAGENIKKINVDIKENKSIFADTTSHWANDMVNELYEKGIISGVETNGLLYYNPDNIMTRAEFSSLISKFMNIDVNEFKNSKLEFCDASNFAPWMENYAKAMYQMGIINGIPSENGIEFRPNDPITRAQAIAILGRILSEEEDNLTPQFTDNADIPDWAYSYIGKLIKNGIIKGYEDNTIRPNNNVTRAEAAALIYKSILLS